MTGGRNLLIRPQTRTQPTGSVSLPRRLSWSMSPTRLIPSGDPRGAIPLFGSLGRRSPTQPSCPGNLLRRGPVDTEGSRTVEHGGPKLFRLWRDFGKNLVCLPTPLALAACCSLEMHVPFSALDELNVEKSCTLSVTLVSEVNAHPVETVGPTSHARRN